MISSARMMSTPEATSVESVRDKRAMATLRTTEPICIGIRSLKLSHFARPFSVRFQRLKKKKPPPIPPSTKITPGIGIPGNHG